MFDYCWLMFLGLMRHLSKNWFVDHILDLDCNTFLCEQYKAISLPLTSDSDLLQGVFCAWFYVILTRDSSAEEGTQREDLSEKWTGSKSHPIVQMHWEPIPKCWYELCCAVFSDVWCWFKQWVWCCPGCEWYICSFGFEGTPKNFVRDVFRHSF